MAKNRRMTGRDHPVRWFQAWLERKKERKQATRKQPLDEVFAFPSTTESSNPTDDFIPAPQVSTISTPLNTHDGIYQSGLFHQDGNAANLGEMSGFEEGDEILGPNGGDCLRVIADKEGLHKWGVSTLMVNDNGQFSVMVYGKGAASGEDYEYVLSVHQDSEDATPIDQESLVIRWEPIAGHLRLYPNLNVYPNTHVTILLPVAQWQEAAWHKITATWSYQDQFWTLKWDDTEGVLAQPNTVAWPLWDELTQVDIFTDMNFENVIYHYVCHVVTGPITDPEALDVLSGCITGEPTGFPNRTDSTIAFTDGTRLFEINPVGDTFDYYIGCQKYTANERNITITDVEGLHWIYFDGVALAESVNPNHDAIDDILINNALVSVIYWDATNNLGIYVGDERHGLTMDGDTHVYLHWSHGLQWEEGLALNTIDADQSGANAGHAQFGVDAGEVNDEDIHHEIDAVSAVAGLNIFYLDGAGENSRLTTQAGFSCKVTGTGRLAWNEFVVGIGVWQITEVTNNKFVLYHTFASTEKDDPMISIMGQAEYINKSAAQAGALTEINDITLGNLPTPEFRPIATVIYQTSNAYGNAVKARIVTTDDGDDYIDWRTSEIVRGIAISGCCSLDRAYDKGREIDFSSGNGPVKLNFPDGGVTDPIAEALLGANYNIRNMWIQANEGDTLNVSTLYYTETDDDTPLDTHLMGIMSTDSGTNKYLRWRIDSDGIFQSGGYHVVNYPTNLLNHHSILPTGVLFNQQKLNINFIVSSLNISDMFKVDAGNDSVGINTDVPDPEVEFDINGSLARRFGPDLTLSNGENNNIDIGDYGKFRITGPTGAFEVTGFAGGCDGRELIIFNNSSQTMTVEHNEGTSLAANRIASGAGDIVIPHIGSVTFDYDATSNRWRVRSFVN